MASTSEFEQQQFWEDKPIEIILGDNSMWELTNNNNNNNNVKEF